MKDIINLTPHSLNFGGIVIPPSGQIARVSVSRKKVGEINGIPAYVPEFGEVQGLPSPEEGKVFVVSALVRTHPDVAFRGDVASPGSPVRDGSGVIVGADGIDFSRPTLFHRERLNKLVESIGESIKKLDDLLS